MHSKVQDVLSGVPFPPFQYELDSEPNPASAVFPHPGLLQSLSLKL